MANANPTLRYLNNGTKASYRRTVWKKIGWMLPDVPIKERKVVYIDTQDAWETLWLLHLGYQAENLYPCNLNPAIAAHITMTVEQKTRFKIRSYGCDVFDLILKLNEQGIKINAYNFDLCSNLSEKLAKRMYRISPLMLESAFAMTLLRGRETMEAKSAIDRIKDAVSNAYENYAIKDPIEAANVTRVYNVLRPMCWDKDRGCDFHVRGLFWSTYKSTAGSQTMLFFVAKLVVADHRMNAMLCVPFAMACKRDKSYFTNICFDENQTKEFWLANANPNSEFFIERLKRSPLNYARSQAENLLP